MRRLPWSIISGVVALVLLGSACLGGEAITRAPRRGSTAANAPVPPEFHTRNEGGSDGSGLCVDASVLTAGRFHGVPALKAGKGSAFWQLCKSTPGGSYPEKLARYVAKAVPGEKYLNYSGTNPAVLDKLSAKGRLLCMTMNTGELYNNQPIHHMVNYPHYDSRRNVACFVDNNDPPGVYRWITAREAARRWIDGGEGWVFVWLRQNPGQVVSHALLLTITAAVFVALLRS